MVSTLGVMVPQFEAYYGLTDLRVSFVFLVWPVGYVVLRPCASILEAIILLLAFRFEDSNRYHNDHQQGRLLETQGETRPDTKTAIFKHSVTWICAAYFLAYPLIVRLFDRPGGQASGRLVLGVVTDKIGVRTATTVYLIAALAFELLFAAVHVPAVSTVTIALLGFLPRPIIPSRHRHDDSSTTTGVACGSYLVRSVAWSNWRRVTAFRSRSAGRHARDPSLPSSGFCPIGRHASDLVRISKITAEHTA
ncbi:uncharacterized protein F4817DRAFT_313416 [Daldinia loculata]|uniref:uncharacterized protein n=1 Tax=Daldinia loculata TaxID=103429 RepID=UPI0020C2B388|nr:uncharacterized protein F4817DRAFT_313416 [Daldinia loculata]KAI1649688.1 hypothetical protein F4817DRAFT_313416 [Daldinia loculata]